MLLFLVSNWAFIRPFFMTSHHMFLHTLRLLAPFLPPVLPNGCSRMYLLFLRSKFFRGLRIRYYHPQGIVFSPSLAFSAPFPLSPFPFHRSPGGMRHEFRKRLISLGNYEFAFALGCWDEVVTSNINRHKEKERKAEVFHEC